MFFMHRIAIRIYNILTYQKKKKKQIDSVHLVHNYPTSGLCPFRKLLHNYPTSGLLGPFRKLLHNYPTSGLGPFR